MTRVMRDSTTAKDISKTGCQLFAGYDNGSFSKWSTADWALFPTAQQVHIDVLGTSYGSDVLDVELGNPTDKNGRDFSVTVNWVKNKQGGKFLPILYANRSTLTPMFNALASANLHVGKNFLIWIATLDNKTKTVADMTGVVAVQWKPATSKSGAGHYDESIVYMDTWKAAPKPPVVVAPPPPVVKQNGVLVYGSLLTKNVSSSDGGKTWS